MVVIVFSSSFDWYYIHGSRMYVTYIKRNSRTLHVGSIISSKSFFFKMAKKHDTGFWKSGADIDKKNFNHVICFSIGNKDENAPRVDCHSIQGFPSSCRQVIHHTPVHIQSTSLL